MIKKKNIDMVIKAFAEVLKIIDASLVIAGKGKEKGNLINLSNKLGISDKVTFTGFISDEDLPFLYRIADIFTIASIAELQSIATMEAMACGLPVLAAKVMALPELVRSDENGYLFDPGDIKTLSKQIIKVLQNPSLKKTMSQNSLKIISHHNLDNTIRSYEKIYQKTLASIV